MSKSASALFIVDNSNEDWKVASYLREWCELSRQIDVATGYFEVGALLALKDQWQQLDSIRLLMGDEVSKRTKRAFEEGLRKIATMLDSSIEGEKKANDFLAGVPAVVEALRSGKIQCRVYRKDKFHAKCYLTHARQAVIGSFGLVGSSNFTKPGLEDNVELNVQIRGYQVCQKWLKDRKGRTLTAEDIAHYHKIVIALTETIRLMAEIDQVIETHGGWPGAFDTSTAVNSHS
jgi:phosphatidylserine/phosphatidylglycerophosphate/cardiolipin synthase-like enzyme